MSGNEENTTHQQSAQGHLEKEINTPESWINEVASLYKKLRAYSNLIWLIFLDCAFF